MKMPNTRQVRRILATVIVITSVALAGAVLFRQLRSAPPETASRPTSPGIDMAINKLNFSEMRGNDKLWELTAEQAEYDKDTGTTKLAVVKADILDGRAGGMTITSEIGSYDEPRKVVLMQKQVHAVTKRGMVFDTDQLEYRTGPGLILTDHPVKVQDGRLTLHARGMELLLNAEKVDFRGPVDAVIEGYHAKR